jgi:taurine dioxygenase
MASILHLTEVPPLGGDTLFANMYAAYEALSRSMQRFLSELTALHDGARNYEGRATALGRRPEYPRAEHPVVLTHPVTGRPLLFVNRMFTTRLETAARTIPPSTSDSMRTTSVTDAHDECDAADLDARIAGI